MSYYTEYYQRVIHNQKGFKLVLGGTGLGKTSGIIEVIKNNSEESKRFFYVANRLQLLNEMARELENEGIGFCLQERDEEIIKKISREDFERLLQNSTIQKYIEQIFRKTDAIVGIVKRNFELIQELGKNENQKFSSNVDLSDFLNEKVSSIFSFFRNLVKKASSEKNQTGYNALLQNPTIKILFPYLNFKNNPADKRIFLVSLQKSFYGFFDGRSVINLFNLENEKEKNERNIIFLDEFDFLENDLLTQICRDKAIEQPFSFVENFYTVLSKYKLPRLNFLENHPTLRIELEDIINLVTPLQDDYKIPFPQINHFLSTEKELKGTAIFQTRYSVGNFPIFLNHQKLNERGEKVEAFYLEIAAAETKANAYVLLNVVNQATSAIIRVLKKIEFTEYEVYKALVEHCFGNSDKFKRILNQIRQYPYRRKAVTTNESKMYYNGYGLYEIYNFGYPTDSEEVELKYYSMFNTPESILLNLTKNNLVFGLSATAEINRYVKNFDLGWLQNELCELYYSVENFDKEIIRDANKAKLNSRQNKIQVHLTDDIKLPKTLLERIDTIVSTHEDIFSIGKRQKYRKKRLVHFFEVLQWIIDEKKNLSSNILFYSSYNQIKDVLEKGDIETNKETLVSVKKITESLLQNLFHVQFENQNFIVFFLNAEQGKEIAKFEENKEAYYQLFWQNLPVVLVTTYPSAGNGVNLFYFSDKEKTKKEDFLNIHLLDSPFYFFNPIDNEKDIEQSKAEKIKSNIYYLAKLEKNKIITEKQFKIYLNKIRNISDFNNFYLQTHDGLCNRIATYIQALGRVERTWGKMDDQTIILDREVYNDLEDFANETNNYLQFLNFERNKPYFSQNVEALFSQVNEKYIIRQTEIKHHQWEGLKAVNMKCKHQIKELLAKLNLVRENKIKQEVIIGIRKEWQELRIFALRQSFAKYINIETEENGERITKKTKTEEYKLFEKYSCIFETDLYDYHHKCLWIQVETLNVVPYEIKPDSSFYAWELDNVYKNIRNNPILMGYFDFRRYEQGFSGKGVYFTPYFYQCILTGAIGEEVVKAIFEEEKIILNESEIANELFELIDLKLENKLWYIDAKNYSEQTIAHFQLDEEDDFFNPKLNEVSFKKRAKEKLTQISTFHNNDENCKLIYINTFGDGDERPTNYYDDNFNDIGANFEKAKIIIVQSMLKKGKAEKNDNNYSSGFNHFISQLKIQLGND